jgi:hypothetical protein
MFHHLTRCFSENVNTELALHYISIPRYTMLSNVLIVSETLQPETTNHA